MAVLPGPGPHDQQPQAKRCRLQLKMCRHKDADFVSADKKHFISIKNVLILLIITIASTGLYLFIYASQDLLISQESLFQGVTGQESITASNSQSSDLQSLEAFLKQQEEFLEGSIDLSLTKGYSWEDQLYQLPLKVSYDMMLQNEDGTILMSLYSKTKHSLKQTDSTIDVDAVSWQVSDKSTSSLIRTKLFYEIPPQLNTGEVVLERGKIYQIECVLSEKRVAQFIDGKRVTIALITPDQIPVQGHIGFGIMGQELRQPALVGNIQVEQINEQAAQTYFKLDFNQEK